MKKVVIVIPAYNPDDRLEKVICDLKSQEYVDIVVVNDGSKINEVFNKIEDKVILLKHEINKGQGRAVKTGLDYVKKHFLKTKGVITVDADGQHVIEDINKVYEKFLQYPEKMIIGSRNFKKENTPFRSRLGNKLITRMLEKRTKKVIQDTQTGLRVIPNKYFDDIQKIEGERFDFAIQFIIYCIKNDIEIIEVPIQSIYFDKNRGSHYRPIKDSKIIYKSLKDAF